MKPRLFEKRLPRGSQTRDARLRRAAIGRTGHNLRGELHWEKPPQDPGARHNWPVGLPPMATKEGPVWNGPSNTRVSAAHHPRLPRQSGPNHSPERGSYPNILGSQEEKSQILRFFRKTGETGSTRRGYTDCRGRAAHDLGVDAAPIAVRTQAIVDFVSFLTQPPICGAAIPIRTRTLCRCPSPILKGCLMI